MTAQIVRPHVMRPTMRSTIHEVTQRPETRSVWFVTGGSPSTNPGRYPFSWACVHPARTRLSDAAIGIAAHRRRRLWRTGDLSGDSKALHSEAHDRWTAYSDSTGLACKGASFSADLSTEF